MSGAQIQFLKQIITKPIFILRKDFNQNCKSGRQATNLTQEIQDVYIFDIQEEQICMKAGTKQIVHRIFVDLNEEVTKNSRNQKSSGSKHTSYSQVGWILNEDLEICMLCKNGFSMFKNKHHCKSCGNLICQTCSDQMVGIEEIEELGPLRVCSMCYYGQEMVNLVPNHKSAILPVSAPSSPLPSSSSGIAGRTAGSTNPLLANNRSLPPTPGSNGGIASSGGGEGIRKLKAITKSVIATNHLQREVAINNDEMNIHQSSNPYQGSNPMASPMRNQSMNVNPMRSGSALVSTSSNAAPPSSSSSIAAPSSSMATSSNSNKEFDQDPSQRALRLSRYGPLQPITPTPGFVIKTKRNLTGIKIFLNICSNPSIPFKTETGNSSSTSGIDENKIIFMVVGTPVEYQNEKDNSYCIIYDIVVHPDEIYVCTIDSTGAARHRLCAQSLELIHTAYNELVDPSYVILRLASNYKGKTGNGDKLIVRSLIAPHVDAFYSTPQLASVPDTNVGNGGGSGVSSRASVKVTSNPSSAKEEPASTVATASSSRKSGLFGGVFGGNTNTATNAAVVSSSSSSAKQDWGISDGTGGKLTPQAMDKLMRTMVIPREELDKLLATRNFNHILEAMNIYEMKLSELIIYPESGFVILAQRIKPLKKVYINICHHPSIGIVTEQQQRIYEQIASGDHALQRPSLDHFGGLPVNPNQPIPSPVPFIIGKVDNQFIDSSGNKSMIVDIIIPSPILLYVVADPTGQLRDELAIEILQRLYSLNVQLDSNFALPDVPHHYITSDNSKPRPIIEAVFNMTEFEKGDFSMAFIGKLFKQGHRYKTWKERLFLYSEITLQYYDLKMNYQGEFPCEECNAESMTVTQCSAPKATYPFMLSNYSSGGEFLNCYTDSASFQSLFIYLVILKLTHFHAIKSLINIPPMKKGWIKKQGHVVKNWKNRFFILNYGVLTYYDKDGGESSGLVEQAKGKIELQFATVSNVINDEHGKALSDKDFRICVSLEPPTTTSASSAGGNRSSAAVRQSSASSGGANGGGSGSKEYKLILQISTAEEKKDWFDLIRKHIEYAKEYAAVE